MKTTLDSAGRLVIPKEIRAEAAALLAFNARHFAAFSALGIEIVVPGVGR